MEQGAVKQRQRKRDIIKQSFHRKNNQVKKWFGISSTSGKASPPELAMNGSLSEDASALVDNVTPTTSDSAASFGGTPEEEKKTGDLVEFDDFAEFGDPERSSSMPSFVSQGPESNTSTSAAAVVKTRSFAGISRRSSSQGSSSSLSTSGDQLGPRGRGGSQGKSSFLFTELEPGQRFELLVDPIPPSDRSSLVGLSQTWKNMRARGEESEPGMQILHGTLEYLVRFLIGSRGGGHWDAFLLCLNQFTTGTKVLDLLELYLDEIDPSNINLDFLEEEPQMPSKRPSNGTEQRKIPRTNGSSPTKESEIIFGDSFKASNGQKCIRHTTSDETICSDISEVESQVTSDSEKKRNSTHSDHLADFDVVEGPQLTSRSDGTQSEIEMKPGNLILMTSDEGMMAIISASGQNPADIETKSPKQRDTLRRIFKELGLDADVRTMGENAYAFLSYWIKEDISIEQLTEEEKERAIDLLGKASAKYDAEFTISHKDSWDAHSEPDSSFSLPGVVSDLESVRLSLLPLGSQEPLSIPEAIESPLSPLRIASPNFTGIVATPPPLPQERSNAITAQQSLSLSIPPPTESTLPSSPSTPSKSKPLNTRKSPTFILHNRSRSMSHGWRRKKANSQASVSSTASGSSRRKSEHKQLAQYHPAEVAQCLTWMLYNNFYRHIRPGDLVTKQARDSSRCIQKMIETFDLYSWWPLTWILDRHIEVLERVERVSFFLDVATECRRLRNFHTFFGIVAGLSQPMMTWLWDFLKEKERTRFEDLKRAVKNRGDYLVYRADLSKCGNKSHIPFLGLTTKLLFPLEHNIPALSHEQPLLINFGRCVSIQHTIDDFLKGQLCGYECDYVDLRGESSTPEVVQPSRRTSQRRAVSQDMSVLSIGSPISTSRKTPVGSISSVGSPPLSESDTNSPSGSLPGSPQHVPVPVAVPKLASPGFDTTRQSRGSSSISFGSGLPPGSSIPTRLRVSAELEEVILWGFSQRKSKEKIEKTSAKLKQRLCEDLVVTLESSGFM